MKKVTKVVAALMLTAAVIFATGCKTDKSGSQNGHDYVDLGLPSGTLWATCNVGADTPESYGDHFAWGEIESKTKYDWNTYKYCKGDYNTFTKYCINSEFGYNGFTDDLTILQSEDDAATVNWGESWRMPTKVEWEELYNLTTVTWTTRNGVNGSLFTASNGGSLFLPAAGWPRDAGSQGSYWSSSLSTSCPYCAWGLRFSSVGAYVADGPFRIEGQSVRPVRAN